LVQREQHETIQYLGEENRILQAQLHGRRLPLTDDERRRLAVLGKRLGRQILTHVAAGIASSSHGSGRIRRDGQAGPGF
jgi:hypothetical protein